MKGYGGPLTVRSRVGGVCSLDSLLHSRSGWDKISPMRIKASPYLLLVFSSLFWAGNFVLGRAVEAIIPPVGLAFWRWIIALATIAVVWAKSRGLIA